MTTTFQGYRRRNGTVGVRNHVLVLPSVMCANHIVDRIGRAVPEVVTVGHPTGCAQVGADFEQTKRTMAGFAANPNVAAVLVVGLGCETNESKALAAEIAARGQRVEVLGIQESGGSSETIARGTAIVRDLLRETAGWTRETCPLSELILGTECGGSDGFSGITANPALGYASDRLVAAGGTVILAELPELVGAEHLLAARASEPVAAKLYELIERVEARARAMHVDIRYGNPTQGNMAGGLTTIEEKSLGRGLQGRLERAARGARVRPAPQRAGPGGDGHAGPGHRAADRHDRRRRAGRRVHHRARHADRLADRAGDQGRDQHRRCSSTCARTWTSTPARSSTARARSSKSATRSSSWVVDAANGRAPAAEALGFHDFAINRIGPSF